MQERGILTAEDSAKPKEVAREIAKCDAFLRRWGICGAKRKKSTYWSPP